MPVPGGDTTAPLDLQPALVVDARDDHGLGRIEVVSWRVSRLGLVGDTVVDSLPGVNGADRVVQSQLLDLTARGLLPGDTLRYFVRATDRAPAAHTGRTREYVLRLRSMEPLAGRRLATSARTRRPTHRDCRLQPRPPTKPKSVSPGLQLTPAID